MPKKLEQLVSCPKCGTPNFTPQGLKKHKCDGKNRTVVPIAEPSPIPLAEMSIPQLSAAFAKLDEARSRYDSLSGICATLQGLVLIEVKRKVGHGNYLPWLKSNFPKSDDTARNCVRLAEEFISRLQSKNTPESKFRTRSEFQAQQVLLSDLAANLSAIESSKLDLSHPVVAAVAAYAEGRSYRQLLLDCPTRNGGDRNSGKKLDRRTKEEIARDEFEAAGKAHCLVAQNSLNKVLACKGPKKELAIWLLDEAALEKLKLAAKDLYDACLETEKRRKRITK